MGKFISDVIGEQFKEWKRGDIIILAAPTGCGKSTFVLEKLLPYAAERGEKILYLVNRKILKSQIEEKIEEKENVREQLCIKVSTYQHLEERYSSCLEIRNWDSMKEFNTFTYVIADECHYFSLDALYNTRTELSYRWIKNSINSVVVYISATMENVEGRIREDFKNRQYGFTDIYQKELVKFKDRVDRRFYAQSQNAPKIRPYKMPDSNNKHIDIKYLVSNEELCDLVTHTNEKWLIFVDSKDKGRELGNQISTDNKKECVFIDAHFRHDEEAKEEVKNIAENSIYKARVLIVTPVLDNGVSLIDDQLRNIVIMTDMKDSFFQMLGRKRGTGQKINVYLMSLTVREIRERYRFYDKLRDISNACEKEREEAFVKINSIPSFEQYRIANTNEIWNESERTCEEIPENNYIQYYRTEANRIECERVSIQSYYFLKMAFENEWNYYLKFCYLFSSYILLNDFALSRIKMLHKFYKNLYDLSRDKEAYELDENLVRIQMKWLDKTEEEIREIINCGKEKRVERAKANVKAVFEKIIGVGVEDDNYKKTVLEIDEFFYDNLSYLLGQVVLEKDEKKYLELIRKKRVLSKQFVSCLRKYYPELNYKQTVKSGTYYLIKAEQEKQ